MAVSESWSTTGVGIVVMELSYNDVPEPLKPHEELVYKLFLTVQDLWKRFGVLVIGDTFAAVGQEQQSYQTKTKRRVMMASAMIGGGTL